VKKPFLILFATQLLWGFLPVSVHAQSAPAEQATAVFEKFLASFTNADSEGVLDLFAEDALFWGTGSQTLVTEPAGIRQYFSRLNTQTPGETIASARDYSVRVLGDDLVLVSGMWQIATADNAQGTPLRVSMAVARRQGHWQIVQFHNSRVPE